jgi:hypothetical protein
VNPIGYITVLPTKTSYDLASVTMAFTFMKPASSTSSWLSLRDNSTFVMLVVRFVPPLDVLMVHGHQGCHGDGRTDTSVRLSVTSDKARVHHIRVNGMLNSKRVKPELLCPRWLPHHCHVGSLAITL